MIPMFIESLKDLQLGIALSMGGIFSYLGILLIVLWHDEIWEISIAKENLQIGFIFIVLGVLIGVFGLYLIIPLLFIYFVYIGWSIIHAVQQITK